MTVPVLIAQISDLHVKPPGEILYGISDTAAALQRCVARLNSLDPRPACVIVSGDLTDLGSEAEYAHLRDLLAPLTLPLAVIPGNHDCRANLRRAFANQPFAFADGAANLALRSGDLDLLLLDSSVPNAPHGHLDEATLGWLDRVLASAPDRPALLFLHHPPFRTGIRHMDSQSLDNAAELAAVVRRHPRLRLVAAGHVHRATMTMFAGIAATICPAPNHAVALDLAAAPVPSLVIEPPAFHLHAWFPGEGFGEIVTHVVQIGEFGPHPFDATAAEPASSP
jgi:3',5'-cyclic AMP phosphodiesterase CpdA